VTQFLMRQAGSHPLELLGRDLRRTCGVMSLQATDILRQFVPLEVQANWAVAILLFAPRAGADEALQHFAEALGLHNAFGDLADEVSSRRSITCACPATRSAQTNVSKDDCVRNPR
jgi:hypothetical protein